MPPQRTRLFLLVSCCCLLIRPSVSTVVSIFDDTDDSRHNLCGQAAAVLNGTVEIKDALAGLELAFSSVLYDDKFLAYDEDSGEWDGFHYVILEELALRAGFTYTLVGHDHNFTQQGLTYTEYLDLATQRYDCSVADWLVTMERAILGIRTPHAFLDMSIKPSMQFESRRQGTLSLFFSFAEPFTYDLWLVIAGKTPPRNG